MQQALLTLPPLYAFNASPVPPEPARLCESQTLSFFLPLLLLVDTSNNFLLKTVTSLTPTCLHCPFLFSSNSLTIQLTGLES